MPLVEWAMWANEQALLATVFMFLGGCIGASGYFHHRGLAAYALLTSVIFFFLEYPRSKRKQGKTAERLWQNIPAKIVSRGGLFTKNYYVRFVLHLLCSLPLLFQLPLLLSGLCQIIASAIYFSAAYHGEKWIPMTSKAQKEGNEQRAATVNEGEGHHVEEQHRSSPQPAPRSRDAEEVDLGLPSSYGNSEFLQRQQNLKKVLPRRAAPLPYKNVGLSNSPYENVGLRSVSDGSP